MATSDTSFLGTGWSFPPTFLRATLSVVTSSDDVNIHQSLHILFSTSLGERLMVPLYGTILWRRVFGSMTTTLQTEITADVRDAILHWEPRITVDDVTVEANATTGGLISITVDYTIRTTNTRSNFVYPFYLQEGTLAPAAS